MQTSEILKRVKEIQIRTGRQVADSLAGHYESVFRGSGVEFDEVRPYIPGDDVRTIDWNVTARAGAPYVKRFVEERQLTIMLVIDVSSSQEFGSSDRSKREVTAELSALIAFSAITNNDKVGLILFHGDIEHYIPPRKGQKHVLRVIRDILSHEDERKARNASGASATKPRSRNLWQWWRKSHKRLRKPNQATRIADAMAFVRSIHKRKAICFVVSDFLDQGYQHAIQSANQKHDVIAIQVQDPREMTLPRIGLVNLKDLESGDEKLVDTSSRAFQRQFTQQNEARHDALTSDFRRFGVDHITIKSSEPVADPLVRFFKMRERRRRRA